MPAYKYKATDGKQLWFASFYHKNWMGEKKRKVKRGFATKKEALEYERSYLEKGKSDPTLLVSALAAEYLADLKTRIKPTTYPNKVSIVNGKILPYFKNQRVCDIEPLHIRKWQNELLSYVDEKGKGYSPTYLKSVHAQMAAMMNYAVKYYGLDRNPCTVAGSMGSVKGAEMTIWSKEQFEHFLTFEKRRCYRLAFSALFYTGLRGGELLALTPADVPKNEKVIHVTKNYAVVDGVEMFLTPKTMSSVRDVAIHQKLHDDFISYISSLQLNNDERIFHFAEPGLLHELHRVTKKAGLPQIRIHDFRHSHASMLIHMGVPITEISKRLGHDSPATTLRIYSHLYPGNERNIADLIDQIHGESGEKS